MSDYPQIFVNRTAMRLKRAGANIGTFEMLTGKKNAEVRYMYEGKVQKLSRGDYLILREGMRFAVVEGENAETSNKA